MNSNIAKTILISAMLLTPNLALMATAGNSANVNFDLNPVCGNSVLDYSEDCDPGLAAPNGFKCVDPGNNPLNEPVCTLVEIINVIITPPPAEPPVEPPTPPAEPPVAPPAEPAPPVAGQGPAVPPPAVILIPVGQIIPPVIVPTTIILTSSSTNVDETPVVTDQEISNMIIRKVAKVNIYFDPITKQIISAVAGSEQEKSLLARGWKRVTGDITLVTLYGPNGEIVNAIEGSAAEKKLLAEGFIRITKANSIQTILCNEQGELAYVIKNSKREAALLQTGWHGNCAPKGSTGKTGRMDEAIRGVSTVAYYNPVTRRIIYVIVGSKQEEDLISNGWEKVPANTKLTKLFGFEGDVINVYVGSYEEKSLLAKGYLSASQTSQIKTSIFYSPDGEVTEVIARSSRAQAVIDKQDWQEVDKMYTVLNFINSQTGQVKTMIMGSKAATELIQQGWQPDIMGNQTTTLYGSDGTVILVVSNSLAEQQYLAAGYMIAGNTNGLMIATFYGPDGEIEQALAKSPAEEMLAKKGWYKIYSLTKENPIDRSWSAANVARAAINWMWQTADYLAYGVQVIISLPAMIMEIFRK